MPPDKQAALPADATLLEAVPLFQTLTDDDRRDLAAAMHATRHRAGEVVFRFGDPGDCLYLVTTGAVELYTRDYMGQKMVLKVAQAGEVFGELSLLDGGPRTATAEMSQDGALLSLGRDDLMRFLRRHPDAALGLLTEIGHRLRATNERLRQAAARNANEEIADKATPIERVIDGIAAAVGSFEFLLAHIAGFGIWIALNMVPGLPHFDPFPFGLLTMWVSLEAVLLSTCLLLSQNRQAAKDKIRADVEYEVNVAAELEIKHLHEKLEHLHAAALARLDRIERREAPEAVASTAPGGRAAE